MWFEPSDYGRKKLVLLEAATDFFFLQNRSYPRKASLEWVGNRYRLTRLHRALLHRGVFSQDRALKRRAKRRLGSDWMNEWLVVDGHNVQITLESAIVGRPLLKGNDGALRDVAGQSARFRMSEVSKMAVDMLFLFLGEHRPRRVSFLFDAPMSHSGELAHEYGRRLRELRIAGEARAVPVPEREIPHRECTVASSDQAILEESIGWIDLASRVLSHAGRIRLAVDFSGIIATGSVNQVLTCEWDLDFLDGVQDH